MFVCGGADGAVTHASENAAAFIGRDGVATASLIGRSLGDLLGQRAAHALRNAAARAGGSHLAGALLGVQVPGCKTPLDATVHRHEGRVFVELEASSSNDAEARTALDLTQSLVRRISTEGEVQAVAETGARLIRALLGYDRVMVYRFLHNGAGRVIAEARKAELQSFRGQHFPASDIPQQARRLYLVNWIRVIADVGFVPVPMTPNDAAGAAIDMSHAHLRSVSPIHCQYLGNMGVAASMSISVVVDGELWGLIACHHDAPKPVPLPLRISAELFGQYFSLQIAMAARRAELVASSQARRRLDRIVTSLDPDDPIADSLIDRLPDLAKLIACDGAGLWLNGYWHGTGLVPTQNQVERLVAYLDGYSDDSVWNSDEMQAEFGPGYGRDVAGMLAIPLSMTANDYLLLFRSEEAHDIAWAGEPTKQVVANGSDYRLTPRGSFDTWREEVRGRSTPWSAAEIAVAEAARSYLRDVVLRYKEANVEERARGDRRRRLLNDELNHRVKNIIALVKSIALQTGARAASVADYSKALEGRLRALAFAHDQSLGGEGGNLALLIDAEASLHRYGAGAERVVAEGPPLGLDDRAFSVVALVLHEMMTNAAKYGALSVPQGKLAIRWRIGDDGSCIIDWTESGGPVVKPPDSTGFGSTLVRNTISYDLRGSADVAFAPDGVSARFVIPAEHVREAAAGETVSFPVDAGERPLAGRSVLIVEDQALIALDMEDAVRELGATSVRSSASVATALGAISSTRPDCAVLDVNLGEETSAAVADQLVALGVPFVFATGYRDTLMIPERFAEVAVVRKPVNVAVLAEKLKAALAMVAGRA